MPRRASIDLFLISFLILFLELAAIRFFGATVVFLTFFTNIVLLASFLGMSVGLLTAGRPHDLARSVLPLALLATAAAVGVHLAYWQWANQITVAVGGQQASPQVIYFGTENRPADPSRWVIPIWLIGGAFFALIAGPFIGLGQIMGRRFAAIPNRLAAYSLDILGSLTGIALFAAMSWLALSPLAWFAPALALVLYFAGWRRPIQLAAAAATLALVAIGSHALLVHGRPAWSPYYKVSYDPAAQLISTNDIGHQYIQRVAREGAAYRLPYFLNADAGGAPLDEVMIIGAGNGNDVSAALQAGVKHVDAIEIDPVIRELGRLHHPEQPYADARVTLRVDDGRAFARRTERKYDLAVYALVDSLVLHSGYSSLRLENFLFTREAFEDVKRTLKPDGLFVMYNFYRQGWVVGRLAKTAEEVFGSKPLVISLPSVDTIGPEENQGGRITFLIAGDSRRLEAMRARFEKGDVLWISPGTAERKSASALQPTAPPGGFWTRLAPSRVGLEGIGPLPSDDWPQLYLRAREIPWAPIGQGMAVIALLSGLILYGFSPGRRVRLNPQMFFLGAGFMLLETKGVVHMALLFGSTWIVNSIVFFAILVMVLCANLYVLRMQPRRLGPWYALLVAALLVNALVPMNVFLSLAPAARIAASCLVVFVPVFFAGVIFAALFRGSQRPEVDLGSNIAGIVLGGLSEQLSLVLGFSHLLLVAVAYYLLSAALRPRSLPA